MNQPEVWEADYSHKLHRLKELEKENADLKYEIQKFKDQPYRWWVRKNSINGVLESTVGVTCEFIVSLIDSPGYEKIIDCIGKRVAEDIAAAGRKLRTPNPK